jgi:hypothetical protein
MNGLVVFLPVDVFNRAELQGPGNDPWNSEKYHGGKIQEVILSVLNCDLVVNR